MSSFTKIMLLLALLVLYMPMSDAAIGPKIHVNIYNKLGNGLDLTVHCKSKNDDLGEHVLSQDESFPINFRRNFFGNSLFYCSFKWNGKVHRFDIYDQSRDSCHDCKWIILQDNPCLVDNSFSIVGCRQYH